MLQYLLTDGELLVQVAAGALAVTLVGWHLAGVVVCAAARACPQRHGLRRLVRWSPAGVRRLAGIACGASIVLAPVSASAAPAPSTTSTTTTATDEPFVRAPETPGPTTTIAAPAPVPPPAPAPAPSLPAPVTVGPSPTARTYVVVAGDNLWRIAANEIARTTGVADPSDRAIVPYWRAVMDANRGTLRSGDPSLIFPGEIVTLPAH